MVDSPYLTTKEAAVYCRLTPSGLRSAVARGELKPDARAGRRGKHLFRRETLDGYLRRCLVGASSSTVEASALARGVSRDSTGEHHGQEKRGRLPAGITRLEDGKLRLRATFVDPVSLKRRDSIRTLPANTTLTQALEVLDALRDGLREAHEDKRATMPTLAVFCESWLRRKAARIRASTAHQYALLLGHHILPVFGESPIDQIGRRSLIQWRTALEKLALEEERSLRSVRNWWKMLVQVLRDAFADYGLPDITARLEPPSAPWKPHREQQTLSKGQVQQLVEAAIESRSAYAVAIALMAYTGMRRGEVIALRWEDVDLSARLLTVARSATCQGGHWSVGSPKNGRTRRVGLIPELVDILKPWRRRMLAEQHAGLASGLVCPAPRGGFASYRGLRQALDRTAKRVGIEQRVTAQVLRRTYNTLALRVMDRVVAQAIVGHSDDAMSSHYLGLRDETIRDLSDRMWRADVGP